MDILIILVPATIFIALIFLIAFLWAVRTGQFDDIETPALKILIDHKTVNTKGTKNESTTK